MTTALLSRYYDPKPEPASTGTQPEPSTSAVRGGASLGDRRTNRRVGHRDDSGGPGGHQAHLPSRISRFTRGLTPGSMLRRHRYVIATQCRLSTTHPELPTNRRHPDNELCQQLCASSDINLALESKVARESANYG